MYSQIEGAEVMERKEGLEKQVSKELQKETKENHAYVAFDARSVNESFARMAVMAFMTDMNPTLDELEDVRTAVSEAVTNAIIHGYDVEDEECFDNEMQNALDSYSQLQKSCWQVEISCRRKGQKLVISVVDHGIGIADVEAAKQPFFTTKPEKERSGMGFSFMETFMDELDVYSKPGEGTRVTMTKYIANSKGEYIESDMKSNIESDMKSTIESDIKNHMEDYIEQKAQNRMEESEL